jgi:type IV pilus assembly protein PilE
MRKLSPLPGSRGFTLIELMIVVAVIGILLAIGVPNYQEYVLRSKLTDALSSLSQLRVSEGTVFPGQPELRPGPSRPRRQLWRGGCGTRQQLLHLRLHHQRGPCPGGASWPGFLITATGVAAGGTGQFTYTIDEANNRQTTGLPAGRGVTPANCWLTAKGQTC